MGRKAASRDDTGELPGLDDETVSEGDGEDQPDSVEVDADSDDDALVEDSVEVNVEDLIARIEADAGCDGTLSARRKLEQYMEERRTFRDIMDFEDYDLDD